MEKLKMQNFYRSRQASLLKQIQENNQKKKDEEENQKKKQEERQEKFKQKINVQSNLHGMTQLQKLRHDEMEQIKKSKMQRSASDETVNKEKENQIIKEAQKKLKEKQLEYINKLKEQQQNQKEKQEEEIKKKEDLKKKMTEFVMVHVKKEIENGNWFIEDQKDIKKNKKLQSENLKGLDLETTKCLPSIDKKQKVTVQDIEENKTEEDDEYDQEFDEETGTQKPKRKLRIYNFITDLTQWKKKQRLPDDTKVFIVLGGYPDVKKALKSRGWVQNPDPYSPCFDYKYALQARDIDMDGLKDFQIVNHFAKNVALTTKIGVCKNMRNLIWFNNVDIDSFYPRCYDLNDPEDMENFIEDFKTTKAESILKTYMRLWREKSPELEKIKQKATISLQICERKVRDINDIIDDKTKNIFQLVQDKEWSIIAADELTSDSLAVKKHQAWLDKIDKKFGGGKKKKNKKKKKKKTQQSEEVAEQGKDSDSDEIDDSQMDEFTLQIHNLLQKFQEIYPQSCLNGENNIWIVKPAGLSRGRGIICFNNLIEIQDHVKSKEMQWIIQKYIENPLIIHKRKFDIRVWVTVTDLNPLTIWVYNQLYIRFAAIDYSTEAKQLSDKFMHLTNNAISSQCNKEQIGQGNMYSQEDFQNYLQDLEGEDIFTDKIKPSIHQSVIYSLQCAQDQLDGRKNSHEMFGYDFMVDENYNVWFIEINSSPSMDYSTSITTRLVKQGLEDLVKLTVDYHYAKKKKGVDTGGWKRIFKGATIDEKPNNVGVNLCLEGIALKKTKCNLPKIHNIQFSNGNQ